MGRTGTKTGLSNTPPKGDAVGGVRCQAAPLQSACTQASMASALAAASPPATRTYRPCGNLISVNHWTALPPLSSMQPEKRASTPESSRLQAAGRSGRVADVNDAAGSGARGRRRRRRDCVLGDRGYDAKAIRQGLRGRHMLPFSCEVQHRAWERAGPMAMGSRIERPFAWLNQFRRLRVRYENTCRHDMTTRCIP
jgi:hypothetical protein